MDDLSNSQPPAGSPEPTAEMLEALYSELRQLARDRLRRERPGGTLRTTELVHEAYLRLGKADHGWANRAHYFASAAEAMRRILIERARARARDKRGGESGRPAQRISFSDLGSADLGVDYDLDQVLAIDGAINKLQALDDRAAKVVRLRFYAGLSVDETAEALGVAARTVKRDWTFARAWLFKALGDSPA
jgi:RNA polymerase sigma factor (TIGR02999 family)